MGELHLPPIKRSAHMSTPNLRTPLKFIKKSVKSLLQAIGYRLEKNVPYPPHWETRLLRLKTLGFEPKTVLDGGAHQGTWAKKAHRLFPHAHFLLVEPNPENLPKLFQNTKNIPHLLAPKALWHTPHQTLPLHLWDQRENTGASLLPQTDTPHHRTLAVTTTTIDTLCQEACLTPELIKLDLQGTELQALQGGIQTLQTAQVLLIEFGLTPAYQHRSTPRQLLELVEPLGFQLQDIVDLSYNSQTQSLYGGDFILYKPQKKV